jgi:hypothetical protein
MSCMVCARCAGPVAAADAREYSGRMLCEDCYLEALSPLRTCDPWAVHLARSLKDSQGGHQLTPGQERLLALVTKRGEVSFADAAGELGLQEEEVRRLFAVLRHMELLRATKRDRQILMTRF